MKSEHNDRKEDEVVLEEIENGAETSTEHAAEETVKKSDAVADQLMRITADFANYKRRIEKERASWISNSKISVIESFLPLIDELDLAIKQSESQELSKEVISWLDGFKLMQKNMKKKLTDLGVVEIDCSGEFDPQKHEALMQVANDEVSTGQIVTVLVPGYQLGDEVIRHAKVSVAE